MRFAHAHAIAATVHATSVIVLVLLAGDGDYTFPLYLHYAVAADCKTCVPTPTSEPMGSVNILSACALFGLWSALCHCVAATQLPGHDAIHTLRAVRAANYAVSAPMMLIVVYVIVGGTDTSAVVLGAALMSAVVLLDYFSRDKPALGSSAALGLYVVVWIAVVSTFAAVDAPAYVAVVVGATAVLFTLFTVVRLVMVSFAAEETAFMTLSMVATTTLHWTLFDAILGSDDPGSNGVVIVAASVVIGCGLGAFLYCSLRLKPKID
jgi:hypothetical protein